MTKKQILKKAMGILDKHFAKNVFARNKDGYAVGPRSKEAVRFCALGAIHRAAPKGTKSYKDLYRALDKQIKQLYPNAYNSCGRLGDSIPTVNDDYGKKAIIRVFKEAIKNA